MYVYEYCADLLFFLCVRSKITIFIIVIMCITIGNVCMSYK